MAYNQGLFAKSGLGKKIIASKARRSFVGHVHLRRNIVVFVAASPAPDKRHKGRR